MDTTVGVTANVTGGTSTTGSGSNTDGANASTNASTSGTGGAATTENSGSNGGSTSGFNANTSNTNGSSTSGGGGGAVPSNDATYPLKVSADRTHLVDQNNRPFFIQGDAAWSLIVQLDEGETETYLASREQLGVNLIMVNLLEHMFASNPPRNANGDGPFTTPNDFSTPNGDYFDHAEWVVDAAAAHGIVVLLCPAYLGYDGGDEGWYQTMVSNGSAVLGDYGRYVGERFAEHDNIIWLNGGDYTPPQSGVALVNAVAEGIKEFDDRHIHSVHWGPETSGSQVNVSGWLDLNSTYTYEPTYIKSLADYERNDDRPHFYIEGCYEQGLCGDIPASELRGQAYHAILTGAVGHIFGNNDIWQFSPNWANALNTSATRSMRWVRQLFEGLPWTELVPDADNAILVGGLGTYGERDYAVLAATPGKDVAVAYVPTPRAITIDADALSGSLRARVFDPANGSFEVVTGSSSSNGRLEFDPPGNGDWVLVLYPG